MLTELLCRIFIKNPDAPDARGRYGTLAGIVGIVVNVLLFIGKFIVGTLTYSISVIADAMNNLSDAGSSVISFISFRISAKPADRKHPFGHARIEYIASMAVSFSVLLVGYQLFRDSLDKIINGGETEKSGVVAIAVLAVSILCKLWLCLFNRKLGKKISSGVMQATAADSLSDALSTSAVLLAALIYRFTDIDLDAYMGIAVSVVIFVSGIGIFREATDSILGTAPDPDIVDKVKAIIFSHPEALGIHDMVIHNYGPGRCFISSHVEVDGEKDIYASHDVVDNIEKELEQELGFQCVIHLDPIAANDPMTIELREKVLAAIRKIDERLNLHDFRFVPGNTHSNLIFDVVAPFELKKTDEEIVNEVEKIIRELNPKYFSVVTLDRQ